MPSLQIYLIGAPVSGKSTVFDALVNSPQGPSFTSKGAHRIGMVKVPDVRLERLRDMFKPKKFTPAEVTFVDVAMPSAAEKGQAFTALHSFLSDADAFAIVIQAFGEMDYAGKPLNSASQFEDILLELIMSDISLVEKRLEKIAQEAKRGLKQNEPERIVLERCKAQLEGGGALRDIPFSDEEEKRISSFRFLSQKRALVLANVSENKLKGEGLEALKAAAGKVGMDVMFFCAPLEAEIAGLATDEQTSFLNDYGLGEPARNRVIQVSYHTLNLISFFTVGEDEVRAWTIRADCRAQAAAGKIHSDIERGFIRAETVFYQDLLDAGSLANCKKKGLMRLEGKDYPVKDGDVIDFRFNA